MKKSLLVLALLAAHVHGIAGPSELTAGGFMDEFAASCVRHLPNLNVLRSQLRDEPELPEDKAKDFLAGQGGKAWQVPPEGQKFVLVLPEDKKECRLFAWEFDASQVEREFALLFAQAPTPFVSRLVKDERYSSHKNGRTHQLSYQWSTPDGGRKLLFNLKTSQGSDKDSRGEASSIFIK